MTTEFKKAHISLRIQEAIKEGADLSLVADEIKLWILRNELHCDKWPAVKAAIEGDEWYAAEYAEYAAWSAAECARAAVYERIADHLLVLLSKAI